MFRISGDNFGQAIGLIVVGSPVRLPVALALGWVFVRRRSIWAAIGLHAAFNAVLLSSPRRTARHPDRAPADGRSATSGG